MMKIEKSILLLVLLIVTSNSIYTLYKHPIESGGSRCLDGSEAGFYYNVGKGDNKNKLMLYFDSGGLCAGQTLADTLESCYKRSFSSLGSTRNAKPERDANEGGLLSQDPEKNPVFHDWTKFFIIYCDGSEYQGYRQNPIPYKDRDLYFRGANNVLEHFRVINQTFGLYSADKVVLTGVSAGGIATYMWSHYVYERSINKQVFSLPDSGLFVVDFVNPFTGRPEVIDRASSLMKLISTETDLSVPECESELGSMLCFNAGVLVHYGYFKNPFFIIESLYDQWSVENILGLQCTGGTPGTMTNCSAPMVDAMESYRKVTLEAFKNFTEIPAVGIWAPSCIQHGFSDDSKSFNNPNYKVPTTTGISLPEAIQRFLDNPTSRDHFYIDQVGWPQNTGCSGLKPIKPHSLMAEE